MLHKSKDEAVIHRNSQSCEVKELGSITSIDGADIVINGRYPDTGYSLNEASSFVIRMLSGSGIIATRDGNAELKKGDVVFIEKGEACYFEGQNLTLFMASSPAWTPGQYSNIDR